MSNIDVKGKEMLLYLKETIRQCGNDDMMFFQTAYYWCYQKHHDCVTDICQYKLHAVVPRYVRDYLKSLQDKQNAHG